MAESNLLNQNNLLILGIVGGLIGIYLSSLSTIGGLISCLGGICAIVWGADAIRRVASYGLGTGVPSIGYMSLGIATVGSIAGLTAVLTVLQGPRLPPQDEIDRRYGDRRVITVNGEKVELKVKTGRIWIELYEDVGIEKIRSICDKHIENGFDINTSKAQYIRKQRTVTDDIKYGSRTELPEEYIGISDTRSQFSENVDILRKDQGE